MGSFIFFLQREIKRLTKKIATLSERQEYGGRLSVEFREKNLMDLVDALNTWVDENEQKRTSISRNGRKHQTIDRRPFS